MTGERQYREAISFFEIALCLCILCIHALAGTVTSAGEPRGSLFLDWLGMVKRMGEFVVQGFLFASALKQGLNRQERLPGKRISRGAALTSYAGYISRRVRRVCFPYLVWVVIFYLYFVVVVKYFSFSAGDLTLYILRGDLVSHFYFVPLIMQFYLVFPLLQRLARRVRWQIGLSAALFISLALTYATAHFLWVQNLLMWDRVFLRYLVYWMLGTYASLHYRRFYDLLTRRRLWFQAFGVIAAVVLALQPYFVFGPAWADVCKQVLLIVMILWAYSLALVCERADRGRASPLLKILHGALFYVYLSHPLALFIATRYWISPDASLLWRFSFLLFVCVIPPYLLSAGYVRLKMIKKGAVKT
ncbi:MAG: acyltransferase [Oscillospiraceae bacterium]|jgi:surface polysaccharide O-acyltransferase-like enzyme|nr:acyltransferase [Oscillospiraceae bacterium]